MAVTYKKLFHLMIDRGMTNAELMERAGFSANIITRLKRNNYLSLDTIEKIANALDVPVSELIDEPKAGNFTCPKCGTSLRLTAEEA